MPAPSKRRRLTAFAVAMAVLIATPLAVIGAEEFTDVPGDNPHRNDIAWLADAAVTLGCNPPANTNYCPDQPVRRDQMASFLRRLAENQVVDAATLEGATSAEIVSGFAETGPASTGNLSGVGTLEEIEVEAPADGYLQILGSTSMVDTDGGTILIWLQLDNSTCDNSAANTSSVGLGYLSTTGTASNAVGASGLAEGTVPVTAGNHTVTLCANAYVNPPSTIYAPSISATFLTNATVSVGLHAGGITDLPGTK